MTIYFLGGKSEFYDKIQDARLALKSDIRFFYKIGSFAKAIKAKNPQLILAEEGFLGAAFDLDSFLSEQKIKAPVLYFNGTSKEQKRELLRGIKRRCKIPKKLLALLECLCDSSQSQSLAQIKARLLDKEIEWSDNCARVALCRLKKLLKAQREQKMDLSKEVDGYKLVILKEA